jgi:transcriptional regulator EpsA
MPVPADETVLIKLLDTIGQINTGDGLVSWVRQDLQLIFPHNAFICGLGRIHPTGVAPVKLFAWNFPADYLRALKQPDGLYFSAVMANWLATAEVQLLDTDAAPEFDVDRPWLDRFKASGLQNIASHGVYDFSRQYASYFSFHRIPGPLGERHRFLLNILVPAMHAALLRILHKIKAENSAVRTSRALTSRELEVLMWICEGKTSSEIASILGVAPSTVRNQTQSVLVKLRVNTRAEAAAKAIKKGLVISRHPDSQFGGL